MSKRRKIKTTRGAPRTRWPATQSAGSAAAKKAAASKISPKAPASRKSAAIARLERELSEALEQQTATSEVLKVVSSSPGELAPVFKMMMESALRLCQAKFGVMFRFDGDLSYAVATSNLPPDVEKYLEQRGRRKPTPGSDLDRSLHVKGGGSHDRYGDRT